MNGNGKGSLVETGWLGVDWRLEWKEGEEYGRVVLKSGGGRIVL